MLEPCLRLQYVLLLGKIDFVDKASGSLGCGRGEPNGEYNIGSDSGVDRRECVKLGGESDEVESLLCRTGLLASEGVDGGLL